MVLASLRSDCSHASGIRADLEDPASELTAVPVPCNNVASSLGAPRGCLRGRQTAARRNEES